MKDDVDIINKTVTAIDDAHRWKPFSCDEVQFLAGLTPGQRIIHLVDWLEFETVQGGFAYYFVNSAGNYAHEALAALVRIGAKKSVATLRAVMKLFPRGVIPADRDRRCKVLRRIEDDSRKSGRLWKLFARFLDDYYADRIHRLLENYVAAHRDEFVR